MTDIFRGDLLTVRATPKDADGNPTAPATIELYLNYKHADEEISTDDPIDMVLLDDKYVAEWDSAVALPGVLQGSIRTADPPAAYDFKLKIKANAANPAPTP